jgi:lipoprotein-releasing system ATP-binding protein
MASPIIELNNIRKTYNEGTPIAQEVLHGVSFTVHEGEFTALIGPSGSGKSTLLNILGLLEPATSGSYRLNGQEVTQASEADRTRARLATLGFVFQFHHLLPAFTVLENVLLPGLIRDRTYTPACRVEALRLLEAVGLSHAVSKKPNALSGGMQQRVAIARALILTPKLVLADEPTGNLDTQTAADIFALLRRFNQERGTAFVIVTHDPRLAARCDRQIRLVDGVIVEDLRGPSS